MIYFAYPGDLDTRTGGYRYDRRLITELRHLGVEVNPISLPLDSLTPNQDTLERVGQIFDAIPDQAVVIVDGLAFGVLDAMAAKQARRLRLVALCHHPLALETGVDESLQATLLASERRALHCARASVVTSHHTRQILIDQFDVPAETICAALPGTERVPFAPCDGDPIRLLTIASLTRRKAHDVIIDALAQLDSLPWQARFVGGADFDPGWAASLQARVDDAGLTKRIQFAGSVVDTEAEYQQADVFVLPSRYEGYGMVFAEALAAGLPVVAARSGAVPDVVPNTAGLLVETDDVEALTYALRQVITDEVVRRRLQSGARNAAESLPIWSETAKIVAAKIDEVGRA